MVAYLRQYLQTALMLAAGFFMGWPLWLIIVGVVLGGLLDTFVVGRRGELSLYRRDDDGVDRIAFPDRRWEALCWLLVAMVLSAGIPLLAKAVIASGQGIANMIGLLIACTAGSVWSLALRDPRISSRGEFLERVRPLPDALFVVDLLPRRASLLVGSFVRLVVGFIGMLPFVAVLRIIDQESGLSWFPLFMLGLAAFFQLGLALVSQGLFSLRWWRFPSTQYPIDPGPAESANSNLTN